MGQNICSVPNRFVLSGGRGSEPEADRHGQIRVRCSTLSMRESPKTEKMHLGDAYEEWLKHQNSKTKGTRHQTPPGDLYEEWVKKRVGRRKKSPGRAASASK